MNIKSIKKELKRNYKWLNRQEWWAFPMQLQANISNHYVSMISAGIAFYFLMAAFPALGAAISIFGLVADPQVIAQQIASFENALPHDVVQILADQAERIARSGHKALSLSLVFSILLTVYSTTQGAKALITGCNIAFDVKERRRFIRLNVVAYLLTLFLVVLFLTMLAIVAVIPAVVAFIPLPAAVGPLLLWVRWPVMFLFALVAISVIYSFAPDRERVQWQGLSLGAVMATVAWVLVSAAFSLYVSHFGKYNQVYGSLGAVIVLLLWFWLTAMAMLCGAELDALRRGGKRDGK